MDNIEIVEKVLDVHGCQDAAAIARDAKRIFNYDITNDYNDCYNIDFFC